MNEHSSKELIGTWRLLSVQLEMADTKERIDLLGEQPSGRIIFTDNGRMMAILTAADRHEPKDQSATADLFKSMMAYSGRFQLSGSSQIVIDCDLSWHPAWVGTDQVRFVELHGDRLSIRSGLQTHPALPGRDIYGVIDWERET